MSASFYDLMRYAKTGVASSGMTTYDKMKARAMFCGGGVPRQWEDVRKIVRDGLAPKYFPIGSIIYDNFDPSTGTAFQVVAYDNQLDPNLVSQGYTHSMTLCELFCTDVLSFDATEAFFYNESALTAGTYRFKIPDYDASHGGNKTYYFTSTEDLPANSQLIINWPSNQNPQSVSAYSPTGSLLAGENTTITTGWNALTLTEYIEGESPTSVDLGNIAGPTNQVGSSIYGKMNNITRARAGSNNYYQSGLRQYINSNSAAGTWWKPQTIFDRPYENRNIDGRLTKLNQDMVSVMATPTIQSITNNYFEYPSLDGTTFTLSTNYDISTDKMFLLSPKELNLNYDSGSTMNYYVNADNSKRIKRRKSGGFASYWWLRTPTSLITSNVRIIYTTGDLGGSGSTPSFGVAPACIIQ